MVLRELTDVMQLTVPRMREVSTLLREQSRPTTEEVSKPQAVTVHLIDFYRQMTETAYKTCLVSYKA